MLSICHSFHRRVLRLLTFSELKLDHVVALVLVLESAALGKLMVLHVIQVSHIWRVGGWRKIWSLCLSGSIMPDSKHHTESH